MENYQRSSESAISYELLTQKDIPKINELFETVGWQGYNGTNDADKIPFGAFNTQRNLVGFGAIRKDHTTGKLTDLCVHPIYRRQGIAAKLIEQRVEFADNNDIRSLYVVLTENNRCEKIYTNLGFIVFSSKSRIYNRRQSSSQTKNYR